MFFIIEIKNYYLDSRFLFQYNINIIKIKNNNNKIYN